MGCLGQAAGVIVHVACPEFEAQRVAGELAAERRLDDHPAIGGRVPGIGARPLQVIEILAAERRADLSRAGCEHREQLAMYLAGEVAWFESRQRGCTPGTEQDCAEECAFGSLAEAVHQFSSP